MRTKRRDYTTEENSGIDVSPLLDMVFILLIFFVVTSTFTKDAGVEVKRPQASSSTEIKDQNVQVAITKDGTIFINQKQVDLLELESLLKREKSRNSSVKAVIIADDASVTGMLVRVIDKCNLAGIKDVSLAALKK